MRLNKTLIYATPNTLTKADWGSTILITFLSYLWLTGFSDSIGCVRWKTTPCLTRSRLFARWRSKMMALLSKTRDYHERLLRRGRPGHERSKSQTQVFNQQVNSLFRQVDYVTIVGELRQEMQPHLKFPFRRKVDISTHSHRNVEKQRRTGETSSALLIWYQRVVRGAGAFVRRWARILQSIKFFFDFSWNT